MALQKRPLLLLLISILLTACSGTEQHIPSDMHYNLVRPMEFDGQLLLPGGELLAGDDFRYFFQRAHYVLIGESHTNMTDHISQAVILEKLAMLRMRPVLGLEMLDVDAQPVLDRFNAGEITVETLADELDWSKNVGFPFDFFKPVFDTAAKYGIAVYALNIPRRVVREVRINGLEAVAPEDKKYLPANYIPPSIEQQNKLQKLFAQHMDYLSSGHPYAKDGLQAADRPQPTTKPQNGATMRSSDAVMADTPLTENGVRHLERQKSINGYIRAQALWDSVMAENAARVSAETGRPVVITVGTGHVEYGWGIAMRLRAADAKTRVISIMPWRTPMERAFMDQNASLLLSPAQTNVFPPADLGDAYYYSPLVPVGKSSYGMVTGQYPAAGHTQLIILSVDKNSPAEQAGLQAGDIVMYVGERKVGTNEELYSLLSQYNAYSAPVKLTILRNSEKIEIILPLI